MSTEEFLFVGGPWAGEVHFARPYNGIWKVQSLKEFAPFDLVKDAPIAPLNIDTTIYNHRQFHVMDHHVNLMVENDTYDSFSILDAIVRPEARHLFRMFGQQT